MRTKHILKEIDLYKSPGVPPKKVLYCGECRKAFFPEKVLEFHVAHCPALAKLIVKAEVDLSR